MTVPRIPFISGKLWSSKAKYPTYRGGVNVDEIEAEMGNAAAQLVVTLRRPGTYTIKLRTLGSGGRWRSGPGETTEQLLYEGTLPLPTSEQQEGGVW